MTSLSSTLTTLVRDGFILVYNSETLDIVETARALQNAGINNMEVTCRIKDAAAKLRRLKNEVPGFQAGAASLLDYPVTVSRFNAKNPGKALPSIAEMIDAGADYLVSAVAFRAETFASYAGKLPMIPGCATGSEVLTQYELGASFCKLFPASLVGGVKWLEAVEPAIHRVVSIMPTGGTTVENIPDFAATGTLIFGGSFSMIAKDTLKKIEAEQDYALLAAEFTKIKRAIDAARSKKYPEIDFKSATLAEVEKVTGRDFNVR
jgi:2-dehydro-3-deoxyphosphogluconate aldolase / (4S)-4-hydroxy-2-oxoglutarate aldolase